MKRIIIIFQELSMVIGFAAIILILIPIILGIKPFIVLSGSMEPEIETGAIAYVNTRIKPEEIKVGDVIGFEIANGQATHRVIQINEDKTFVTKGDSNENEDAVPVTYQTYKGKTVFSIPYIGRIIAKTKTRKGVFLVTVFVGLNVLCVLFEGIAFELESEEEKRRRIRRIRKYKSKKRLKGYIINLQSKI